MEPSPKPVPASPPRYEPRRIRSVASVAVGVVVCLLAAHFSLDAALGAEPGWLVDEHPPDWRFYEGFGKQVAGAEWQEEHRPEQFPKRYGMLIGSSTISMGPLPDLVEAQTGYPWLLLGVGGPKGVSRIQRSLHVVQGAGLHCDTLLLGMHPSWLASGTAPSEEEATPLAGLWFLKNQRVVSNFLYTWMQNAREGLATKLGYGAWMAFPPTSADPWHPAPAKPVEVRQPEAQIALRHQEDTLAGRYDATRYSKDSAPMRELATLLRELEAMSDHMIVALLPEHSWHREHTPDVATRLLIETVNASTPSPPPILDLRDSMRDEWFIDSYHLTMKGRRELSKVLGQHITELSPPAP